MNPRKCARWVGLSLISLSLVCIVANALLLVPDGKTWSSDQLSLQVLLMPGFIGGGLMVLCPGITVVLAAGGHPKWILRSFSFSALGMLGAIYCLFVSAAGLRMGPKCSKNAKWAYHLQESSGAYLSNHEYWNLCEKPPNVVPWNVTLFSLLMVASCLEILLCSIHLVNPIILPFV
ncbi:transmembrane 4 L6 family member 5-like [Marmota flaviventris]|uniref:transmembrane 4 L6 family member 5-like n=1 Tax=Marmota flaviventris TaxID=93162 RepID=UPI003A8603D4